MLYRLAYLSHSLLDKSGTAAGDELHNIMLTARRNNALRHVTGALLCTDRYFAQVLEGKEADVKEIYQVICRDPRHERRTILTAGPIETRQFGRWSMASVASSATAQDALAQVAINLPQALNSEISRTLLSVMADAVTFNGRQAVSA
ncbi:Blue light- and temperature-regulated antirepressor YcgF [Methyloligella halotolerans]|uniref:Blue light-and temperature-regulated antirepressor YcgF n=1 Tax=Methyloligella halotolerans TaxID=1177755 RepID=A0A1E2S2U9_9HYPH|nr:BLUF domain-containing protein [Methyloligella halotolerans]ODA68846.1 Blue light- and temperature-regulated antirepressor YcgF [Methyloligella halotolerans]